MSMQPSNRGDVNYANKLRRLGRRVKAYREGRKCKVCGATLSIYNNGNTCFNHSAPSRKRGRPRK